MTADTRGAPIVEIASVSGLSTVQDRGRPGRMHEGIPPGGALLPGLLARANAAVENALGEAAIEVFGSLSIVLLGDRPLTIATEEGRAIALQPGERFELPASKHLRARYLAVRGGLDVPEVLGGRGTLLVANLGGHQGRPLRRGDRLAAAARAGSPNEKIRPTLATNAPIAVHLGPDHDAFAPETSARLLSGTFVVSPESDRIGTRLVGPALPHRADRDQSRATSSPMVKGAIEITSAGEAIVLGPDHPTTGGYPVLAVIAHHDLDRFFGTPVRDAVHFALA